MTKSELPPRVLVVDDDQDIRLSLVELLSDDGYTVSQANDGSEALKCLRSGPPISVILLDLMMPVMDGYGFIHEQRKDPTLRSVPVILLSASGKAKQEAEAMGVSDGVNKPCSLVQLLSAIERACRLSG